MGAIVFSRHPDVPTVITYNVTNIGTNSAQCGGDVTDDGGSLILQKGICWDDSPNPTASLPTKSTNGIGIGSFMATMNFLQSGKTYYVRAYAINVVDTVYGSEKAFQMPELPVSGDKEPPEHNRLYSGCKCRGDKR
jgi:hypothetical protein